MNVGDGNVTHPDHKSGQKLLPDGVETDRNVLESSRFMPRVDIRLIWVPTQRISWTMMFLPIP